MIYDRVREGQRRRQTATSARQCGGRVGGGGGQYILGQAHSYRGLGRVQFVRHLEDKLKRMDFPTNSVVLGLNAVHLGSFRAYDRINKGGGWKNIRP